MTMPRFQVLTLTKRLPDGLSYGEGYQRMLVELADYIGPACRLIQINRVWDVDFLSSTRKTVDWKIEAVVENPS